MPSITDPQAILFSDQKVRVMADLFRELYLTCKSMQVSWATSGVSAKFPNDTSPVADTSSVDGRTPITGQDVNNLMNRVNDFVAYMESSGITSLISPGATGIRDTAVKAAVNGYAKF